MDRKAQAYKEKNVKKAQAAFEQSGKLASFTSFSQSSINNPPAPVLPFFLKHAVSCNRFAEGAIFSSAGCPPRDFKEAR